MYKDGLNPVLPNIMNAVVMISAASCGNADMYMSTRALHALAINGHAPKIFAKTLKNGCPLPALLMTLAFCSMTYMTVSQGSSAVFTVFTSLSAIGGELPMVHSN
jgi:amino acid transporter